MRDRQKQRELRRKKSKKIIDKRNGYGIKDLTAYNAVLQIKTSISRITRRTGRFLRIPTKPLLTKRRLTSCNASGTADAG